MKFIILKNKLEQALNTIGKAITGRSARPVLNGVKLEINRNGLYLTASDSTISIITKIPLSIDDTTSYITLFEEGTALINAKNLTEVVRKFDGESLEIEMIDNNVLKIKDNISNFLLNCMEVEEYPLIDTNSIGTKFNLNTKDFCSGVSQTSYAASVGDIKPIIQGVNISAHGTTLNFVATDSFRIAKKDVQLNETLDFSITIPAKTLTDVAKIAENDETIDVTVSEKKAIFRLKDTLIILNVINGTYPEVSRLIPQSFTSTLITDPVKLAASIDRTATLSTDKGCVVRFSMSSNEFKIYSRSQEIGSGADTVQAYEYNGENLEISFTSKYILDALKTIGSGDVKFLFNGDSKPVCVTSTTDSTILALILPVRTY